MYNFYYIFEYFIHAQNASWSYSLFLTLPRPTPTSHISFQLHVIFVSFINYNPESNFCHSYTHEGGATFFSYQESCPPKLIFPFTESISQWRRLNVPQGIVSQAPTSPCMDTYTPCHLQTLELALDFPWLPACLFSVHCWTDGERNQWLLCCLGWGECADRPWHPSLLGAHSELELLMSCFDSEIVLSSCSFTVDIEVKAHSWKMCSSGIPLGIIWVWNVHEDCLPTAFVLVCSTSDFLVQF